MDWNIFFTIIGSSVAIVGFIYTIVRNFKIDFNKKFEIYDSRFELLENRIFQLAMGRTLKEILLEEKNTGD